jgi:hypothetical protein
MIQLQRMPFHAIIKMFWSPSSAPEFQFQIGIDNQEEKKKKEQKRKKKKKKTIKKEAWIRYKNNPSINFHMIILAILLG